MPHRPKVFPRLAVAFAGAIFVTLLAWSVMRKPTIELSIGSLADKGDTYSAQPVIITNAVMGDHSVDGFVIFRFRSPSQLPIVFMLASYRPTPDGHSRYQGTCHGTNWDTVDGCPIEPPFIFVTNVRALSDSKIADTR